jgi:hypothetical protein
VGKLIRVIILVSVLLGTIGLAQRQVAWAGPSTEDEQAARLQSFSPASLQDGDDDDDDDGTVKPPRRKARICKSGNYSLGGVVVIHVKRLAHDYCLTAALRKSRKDPGRIPAGAGGILADITDVQFLHRHRRIGTLPASKGVVEICYAIPPGKQGQMYFREYGKKDWKPLITTFVKGMACAPAQVSGSYALIGS